MEQEEGSWATPNLHPAAGADLDYHTRLGTLLQVNDSKIALIKDMMQNFESQSQQISKLKLQLEDEKETKEKWRGRYLGIAKEAEKATQDPYVAVLIDADGMIFTEPYLLHSHGGQNAATALLQATRNYLRVTGLFGATESFEIVVRAFANVGGVAETLRSRGLPTDFRKFAVGFSQLRSLVDFIDVGRGKEMADAKIAGEIRFHLSNYNCKQVILGVSHDNGYARILSSLLADGEDQSRLTLLEGVAFGKEFHSLPFTRVAWNDLFLSKKVENWVPDFVVRQQQQNYQKQQQWQAKYTTHSDQQPHRVIPEPVHGPHVPPPPYENVSREGQHGSTIYPPPVPRPPVALLQRVHSIKPGPCWNYYLGVGCPSIDKCVHTHTRVLTADELVALRFIAQGRRCLAGMKCKNSTCYYGHRCQVRGVCTGVNCNFTPEEHEAGMYKPETAPAGLQAKDSVRSASPYMSAGRPEAGISGDWAEGSERGGTMPVPQGKAPKGPKKPKAKKQQSQPAPQSKEA